MKTLALYYCRNEDFGVAMLPNGRLWRDNVAYLMTVASWCCKIKEFGITVFAILITMIILTATSPTLKCSAL